jgi:hypothetical protein
MKFLGILLVISASSANACTFCHSETARRIRAAVFGPDFWFNAGVTVLPFAICLGITALIYFPLPFGHRHHNFRLNEDRQYE